MARVLYYFVILYIFNIVSCRILDGLILNPEVLKISTHAVQGNDYMDYNPDHIAKDILIEIPDTDVVIDVPNQPGTVVEIEKWTLENGEEERIYKVVSPGQPRPADFSNAPDEFQN